MSIKNIKYLRQPGYMYDLFFLFILHFNKEYCVTTFINYDKSAEDTQFFDKIFNDVGDVPQELLLFFHLRDNKKSFITYYYFEPYVNEFTTAYDLSVVQTALSDYDSVITNMLKFYFIDITKETIEECKHSIKKVGGLIKNSGYSSELKSALYAFFLDPAPIIQSLCNELIMKDAYLCQVYEKQHKQIINMQRNIDFIKLSTNLKNLRNFQIDIDCFENLYISTPCVFKNCLKFHYYENAAVLILGLDCEAYIDYWLSEEEIPELDLFGLAVSEKNRVQILDLILRKGEIVIKDIEQDLGFTGTNSYYHLSLMIKAGMIKSRNQGRTVFYSINKAYFESVRTLLCKYSNKN